jgi:hypothetical protein
MFGTYRVLLNEIERRDVGVLTGRATLAGWQKLGIATRSMWPG